MRDAAVGDVMDDHPSRFPVAIDDFDGLEVQRLGIERDNLGAIGIENRLALLEPGLAILGALGRRTIGRAPSRERVWQYGLELEDYVPFKKKKEHESQRTR